MSQGKAIPKLLSYGCVLRFPTSTRLRSICTAIDVKIQHKNTARQELPCSVWFIPIHHSDPPHSSPCMLCWVPPGQKYCQKRSTTFFSTVYSNCSTTPTSIQKPLNWAKKQLDSKCCNTRLSWLVNRFTMTIHRGRHLLWINWPEEHTPNYSYEPLNHFTSCWQHLRP